METRDMEELTIDKFGLSEEVRDQLFRKFGVWSIADLIWLLNEYGYYLTAMVHHMSMSTIESITKVLDMYGIKYEDPYQSLKEDLRSLLGDCMFRFGITDIDKRRDKYSYIVEHLMTNTKDNEAFSYPDADCYNSLVTVAEDEIISNYAKIISYFGTETINDLRSMLVNYTDVLGI